MLRLLADGHSNEEIGKRLFISPETVRTHVRKAMSKLDADTRTQAVAIALRQSLISLNERERPLRRADLDPDPLRQFRRWFEDARVGRARAGGDGALATATADGAPSVRMVLLKGLDEDGARLLHARRRAARAVSSTRTRGPRSSSTGIRSAARCASRDRSSACRRRRPMRTSPPARAARRSAPPRRVRARCSAIALSSKRESPSSRRSSPAGRPAAGHLGRLPPPAGGVGVLAAPRQPPARPLPLPPRRRLGDRAARPLAPRDALDTKCLTPETPKVSDT